MLVVKLGMATLVAFAFAVCGCGGSSTQCGPGTHSSGNQCLPDETLINGSGGAGGTGGSGGATVSKYPDPPAGPYPPAGAAADACAKPGTVTDVFDVPGVRAWLAHSWYHCSGAYLFNTQSAGIEVAPDGKWYFLDDQGGTLVRRAGFDAGGTWSLHDNSGVNGPADSSSVQIDFESYQGGGIPAFARFATDPLKLELNAYPGDGSEYVAVQP